MLATSSSLLVASAVYLHLSPKLPTVESLKEVKLQTPLRIYSQNLQLIGEFGEKRRSPINHEDIPQGFIDAILSAEDDDFFSHKGVDFKGLVRAASQLVTTGEIQSGGSTITMQLARNFFLTNRQTFTRKFNEILLSFRIEEELSKEEILALYANKIYLGNRAYGIEAAANVYYGKPISELSTPQLAMIAGLPKAPSAYNPIANPSRALIRRNWILRRMHKLGYLTDEEYNLAVTEPITASYHGYKSDLYAPYIAEMARWETFQKFGDETYTNGYQVITTIDSTLQLAAQNAINAGILAYDHRHGQRTPEQRIENPDDWLSSLSKTPAFGELQPAIVTLANPKTLDILLPDGTTSNIEWDNGLKGLRIHKTQNSRSAPIQSTEELFRAGDLIRVIRNPEGQYILSQLPEAEAAIVAIAPNDGAIRALVGGFNFNKSKFNRATQAMRQPGSNFKPFIYTTALENGFTPASMINDAPVVFNDKQLESYWRPENDSGKFYGPTRLRKALYLSRNLVSIRVLQSLGINKAIGGLERFGFEASALPRDLSLILGSHATTPIKIATGYATFANGGYRVEPYLISSISDHTGKEIFRANPLTVCRGCETPNNKNQDSNDNDSTATDKLSAELLSALEAEDAELTNEENSSVNDAPLPIAPRVIDDRTAYLIDSILKDVVKKGTARKALSLNRSDIAGKTGTTNGPRDAWFSGYNPEIVATAWFGYDENKLLGRNEYGGSAALPIWIDFMKTALTGKKESFHPQPQGLVTIKINPRTGDRAHYSDSEAIYEIFRREDIPTFERGSTPQFQDNSEIVLPEDIF